MVLALLVNFKVNLSDREHKGGLNTSRQVHEADRDHKRGVNTPCKLHKADREHKGGSGWRYVR